MFLVAGSEIYDAKGRKRGTRVRKFTQAPAIKHGAKRSKVVTNAKRGQRANRRSKLINHHRAVAALEKMDDLCERDGHLYV